MNRQRPYFLRTDRLGFAQWTLDDFPLAMSLWGDPKVTGLLGGPFSEEQVQERLAREIDSMARSGIQYWPIFWIADGDFVGCAGVRPYKPEARILELGFHFRPAYWGKGLAFEASQAIIKLAFAELGAAALFAGHHPSNAASQRVLEKLGFQRTHEELYPPTGLMHPSYLLTARRESSRPLAADSPDRQLRFDGPSVLCGISRGGAELSTAATSAMDCCRHRPPSLDQDNEIPGQIISL